MDAREAYSVKVLSDPFVNGDECYFVQNWIEGNEYGSSIFRMAHGRVERVTFGGSERSPSVYGGYLYYISSAGGEESLMRMGRMSGPERVATFGKIHKFLPYNDDMLAIVEAKAEAGTLFVAKRQMYRYDTRGYLRSRKKLVSVKGGRDIVAGDFDVVDFAVSGDDVIVSTTEEDDSTGLHQVYRLISGLSGREKLTGGRGLATSVGFTPSGEAVFIGHRSGIAPWKQKSVMAADGRVLSGGVNCSLDVITDLFVGGAQGLVTDGSLYTIAHEGGDTYVYDVLARKRLTGRGMSVRYFHSSGGNLAYILTEPGRPSLLRFGEQEYDPNPGVRGAEVENFRTGGGEYWFIHSGSERPTVLSVHGGPHMAYGNCYYIEFNFLAANGFNVVYGNPRGSSGYGDDFARACVGDWGGRDFEDVLSFLDDARDRFGLTGKVAITGGSYGGFMTNVAIVKSNRFACAVSEMPVSNLLSMLGTSDIGFWFNAVESGIEDPWSRESQERLLRMSPIYSVKDARTPTMYIHGEEDFRCPIEQSEQMFMALRYYGVDSELVRYSGDSHEHARHGRPQNMVDRLERKLAWFRKYMVDGEGVGQGAAP